MMRYVNVCDDGRGGYHFGPLWLTQGHAREEARYLLSHNRLPSVCPLKSIILCCAVRQRGSTAPFVRFNV